MIGNKIKALLNLRNKSTADACQTLAILQPAYSRKINNNTFKVEELIKLAGLTNTKLVFMDESNTPLIIFDEADIEK